MVNVGVSNFISLYFSYFYNLIWRLAVLLIDAGKVKEVDGILALTVLFAAVSKVIHSGWCVSVLVRWYQHLVLRYVITEWWYCWGLIVIYAYHLRINDVWLWKQWIFVIFNYVFRHHARFNWHWLSKPVSDVDFAVCASFWLWVPVLYIDIVRNSMWFIVYWYIRVIRIPWLFECVVSEINANTINIWDVLDFIKSASICVRFAVIDVVCGIVSFEYPYLVFIKWTVCYVIININSFTSVYLSRANSNVCIINIWIALKQIRTRYWAEVLIHVFFDLQPCSGLASYNISIAAFSLLFAFTQLVQYFISWALITGVFSCTYCFKLLTVFNTVSVCIRGYGNR